MISLIIPVFNEEAILPELFRRLSLLAPHIGPHEIILIDDGSVDRTAVLIEEEMRGRGTENTIKFLSFSRNFGHQLALSAGLDHAKGDAVVILDADLQDPPELIMEFMKKWREGAMVVYGVRRERKEGLGKRAAYNIFYRVMRILADIDIPLDAGDFCLMDRCVVEVIRAMPERNRFLRGLRAWAGFSSVSIAYDRPARFAGEPKYTIRKSLHLALDGIVGFSTVPLKLATYLGFCVAILSFLMGCALIGAKIFFGTGIIGWPSLMVSLFFLGGIQICSIGILGEYVGRIYRETQARPLYVFKKKAGF